MIENIKILPDSLHVKFKDNIADNFPNIWLRDHAKDHENWDQRSHQRKTFTAKLDSNLFIKEATIIENGNYVNILWSDSEKMIKYSTEFLQNNLIKKDTIYQKYSLWKSKDINDQVYFNDLQISKETIKEAPCEKVIESSGQVLDQVIFNHFGFEKESVQNTPERSCYESIIEDIG